jgi:hypothetical protein
MVDEITVATADAYTTLNSNKNSLSDLINNITDEQCLKLCRKIETINNKLTTALNATDDQQVIYRIEVCAILISICARFVALHEFRQSFDLLHLIIDWYAIDDAAVSLDSKYTIN